MHAARGVCNIGIAFGWHCWLASQFCERWAIEMESSTLLQNEFAFDEKLTISRMLAKPADTSATVDDLALIWQPKCPPPPKRIHFTWIVCWILAFQWDIHMEIPRFGVNIRFVPETLTLDLVAVETVNGLWSNIQQPNIYRYFFLDLQPTSESPSHSHLLHTFWNLLIVDKWHSHALHPLHPQNSKTWSSLTGLRHRKYFRSQVAVFLFSSTSRNIITLD